MIIHTKMLFGYLMAGLLQLTMARIGFKKDQSLDTVEFPPRTLQVFHSGIPTGHLRPLGWQRKPDGRVKEVKEEPTPQEFHQEYASQRKPVTLRGVMNDVPAIELWKDDYLKKNFGHLDVHVVVKKEMFRGGPQKMKFKEFLKEYDYEDWYMSEVVPAEMMADLTIPKSLKCGMSKLLMESEMWMSSGGTNSLLHSHADHNLHCVLAGRKDFVLVDPKYKDVFDFKERDAHPGCGASELDMDRINMFKYRKIAEVPWIWSTLYQGDCILIPSTYLHQVRSYGRSFSSTYLWAPTPDVDFSDCEGVDLGKVTAMTEAPFMWTYTEGARQLANARLNAESLRHHLMVNMRNETGLRYDLFEDFLKEVVENAPKGEQIASATDVWSWIAGNRKELPRETVNKLDKRALEKVAKEFNKAFVRPGTGHDEL